LGAAQELCCECPVLLARRAARPRALDGIAFDTPETIDRQERLRRGRQDRPPLPKVEPRREEGRITGPQPAVERPRVAAERRLEAPRQVRLVELAVGDRGANPLHAQPVCATIEYGFQDELSDVARIRWAGRVREA